MWAMMAGLFTSTLWAALQGIAQSLGIGSPGHAFQLIPFLVGLMVHMMNSIVLGLGLLVLVAGYVSLSRGSITLAPVLLVLGYVVLIPPSLLIRARNSSPGD
mgnify:CR=1 FL=1